MATQIPALTEIDAFPTRVLPQESFDAAVSTCMSQLQNMVSELDTYFIPAVNNISTAVETETATVTSKASEAAASALLAATNSETALGSAFFQIDYAGLACRDIKTQRTVRHQVINATLYNRGVIEGAELSKLTNVTRTVKCTAGKYFANGRVYTMGDSTVTVPTNSATAAKTAYIYAKLVDDALVLDITPLSGSIPEGGIEIGTILVANQDTSDTYLSRSTLTDTARREPCWPQIQMTPGYVYVALPNRLISNNYQVSIEILSALSIHQIGIVSAQNKLANGFQIVTNGNADAINVRALVQFFDI